MYELEDRLGKRGVALTKDIVKVAAVALQKNLTALGPLVLPYTEQLMYFVSTFMRAMGLRRKAYVPDFRKGFQHFAFHAGECALALAYGDL